MTLVQLERTENVTNFLMRTFYQPGEYSAPGWSYGYFAIFAFLCLSVQGLGMSQWWTAGMRFEIAGWFASSLQKEVKRCLYYRK